jgi:hypothetical protein
MLSFREDLFSDSRRIGAHLATKCATHSGTRAFGRTDGQGVTTGIPYVKPRLRDGRPPRCILLCVESSARRIVRTGSVFVGVRRCTVYAAADSTI